MFVLFFFDLKKAFDSVPHVSLINKLTALNLNPKPIFTTVDSGLPQ